MRPHLPWLCQGDIFRDAPVIDCTLQARAAVRSRVSNGAAILLTHDCAMDKRNRDGTPRVERLQFAPLKALRLINVDKARNLRAKSKDTAPYEVMYIGEVGEFEETFFSLSDPYWLPAGYFEPVFRPFPEHPEGDATGEYICPGLNDTRMGRLETAEITLLRAKLIAFWTRLEQPQA